jgi:hypothetical protein
MSPRIRKIKLLQTKTNENLVEVSLIKALYSTMFLTPLALVSTKEYDKTVALYEYVTHEPFSCWMETYTMLVCTWCICCTLVAAIVFNPEADRKLKLDALGLLIIYDVVTCGLGIYIRQSMNAWLVFVRKFVTDLGIRPVKFYYLS